MGVCIPSVTDSLGSTFAVSKLFSSALPSTALLFDLASTLEDAQASVSLTWKPRELNSWADELSKSRAHGFPPAGRHKLTPDFL